MYTTLYILYTLYCTIIYRQFQHILRRPSLAISTVLLGTRVQSVPYKVVYCYILNIQMYTPTLLFYIYKATLLFYMCILIYTPLQLYTHIYTIYLHLFTY